MLSFGVGDPPFNPPSDFDGDFSGDYENLVPCLLENGITVVGGGPDCYLLNTFAECCCEPSH